MNFLSNLLKGFLWGMGMIVFGLIWVSIFSGDSKIIGIFGGIVYFILAHFVGKYLHKIGLLS